jgi:phosphoribosylglycinamide formyltransferase
MSRIPITVLISGNGTNLQALIDAQATSTYKIVRVISNRKAAFGLLRAEKADIPTTYHNLLVYKKRYSTESTQSAESERKAREVYDADLASIVLKDESKLVVCAGFMHVFSAEFINPLKERGVDIINLHPAKWGAFDGIDAIARSHAAFMRGDIDETGVMIHYVIVEVDRGQPLIQETVPLSHPADDNLEHLEQRIHEIEYKLIVRGTELAIDRISQENR